MDILECTLVKSNHVRRIFSPLHTPRLPRVQLYFRNIELYESVYRNLHKNVGGDGVEPPDA